MTFKQKVYQQFSENLNNKILAIQQTLNELSDSAKNETKSTAGDKHETALAMLQIEHENTRTKFTEAKEQKTQLERINIQTLSSSIIKGSLIKTNHGYLFLSIAAGKIMVDAISIIALSPQSPLGAKLIGLKINDIAEINGVQYIIQNIE